MKWLIKNAKVYDANSPLNEERHTFLVQEGRIQAIDEQSCPSDVAHIEGEDLGICPSWFDLRAHFCDPGQEHKEDLLSGLRSAAAGGYTDVALLPDTSPVLQDREQFQYLYKKARPTGVQVHMVAALTRDQEGEQLCDLLDLRAAGAVAFSDGLRPLDNPQLLTQALRYLAPFGGLIMHRPQSTSLAAGGCMHEGRYSTAQGLPAVPAHAEEIMVYSGLRVLEYTGGCLHFSCLSSAGSLRLLEEARAKGLDVSCDVAVHQLLFEDRDLQDFSPNYRVNPPFRANIDRRALLKGVANKQIQAIVSDHHPRAFEEKMRPFSEAAEGIISLQSVFPVLLRLAGELPLGVSLRALYEAPRKLLNLPIPTVKSGEKVCFTVFDQAARWRFDQHTNQSRSTNSPFYGQELRGRVVAVLKGTRNLLSQLK